MTRAPAGAQAASSDRFQLVGTRVDGKYVVEAVVAEGGFGVIYRCTHTELQKTVALKVLKIPSHLAQTAQGEFFRKFANEARTIARIEHEAIVRVLDFGSAIMPTGNLAPWMALEWLDGPTVARDLDARAKTGFAGRSPTECLALLSPVIEAVALAHEEGIAHRDIKPGNLMMVTSRRGEVRLKLLDFGVSKVMSDDDRTPSVGQTSTQAHLQMFSLDYAAPEQLSGTRTGPWTDVHALSLVLTEMLTGEQPYEGDDSVEIFSEALSRQRPTPRRWGLDVGPWEAVLQRSLALRPADRFPDAATFLAALRAEVPALAVWREALVGASESPPSPAVASSPPVASSPLPPTPVPTEQPVVLPALATTVPESGRITELLPPSPPRSPSPAAIDDDPDPVQLPIHRVGWVGWAAALLGVVIVAAAVIATRTPAPPRAARARPVTAAPAPAAAPVAAPPPAPIPAPLPVSPAVFLPVPPVPAPAVVPSAIAPTAIVPPPPRALPARAPVRRVRPARESGGRIPIE